MFDFRKDLQDAYEAGYGAGLKAAMDCGHDCKNCWKLELLKPYWIPCSEKLPENEQEVEITYVNKHWKTGEPLYFTCRAFYTDGTMNTEESDYTWNEIDNLEYSEKLDAYIIPEGWWECVSFAEEYAAVDLPVIAWMPLPKPYEG